MKKVLIIEDNDDIRESTAEILDLAGYDTFTAKNGKEGVDIAVKNIPDVILCDIMMPELDGYGVLYLLHKNPKTATIPFIFITAKTERADMRKGMDMGADDYLTKPFDDVELFSAIESRLNKKKLSINFDFNSNADPKELLEELCQKGKTRSFGAKQVVYIEGDDPNYLYFIKEGKIKTYKRFKDERELSAGLYNEGEFFGYESLCSGNSYAENASTLTKTELLLISKADFLEHLYKHPAISVAFIGLLSENIREKQEQMLQLAYFSVRKRVAEALVQVASKFGGSNTDACTIKISRDDLAALVGTASETVSRMLADFKNEKLIDKTGNAINILSIKKLKDIKQ